MAPGGSGSIHCDHSYSESQAGPCELTSGWREAGRCGFPSGFPQEDRAPRNTSEGLCLTSDVV